MPVIEAALSVTFSWKTTGESVNDNALDLWKQEVEEVDAEFELEVPKCLGADPDDLAPFMQTLAPGDKKRHCQAPAC